MSTSTPSSTSSRVRLARHQARQLACSVLYRADLMREPCLPAAADTFAQRRTARPVREFALRLITLVAEHQPTIDSAIEQSLRGWVLRRLSTIDRVVLRVGVAELLYCDEIPARVSINEAVEIAKRYSTESSGRFVNAVLDTVLRKHCPAKVKAATERG